MLAALLQDGLKGEARCVFHTSRAHIKSISFAIRTWFGIPKKPVSTICLLLSLLGSMAGTYANSLGLPTSESNPVYQCLLPTAGAPSCGLPTNPGSSNNQSIFPEHVGNPIHVVSGNKYEESIDFRAFGSGLTFSRHYNSNLSHYQNGLGQGWRHTYQVLLTRVNDDQLNIVQSDGRLIRFFKTTSEDETTQYIAENPEDGVIAFGDRSVWHLSDERRLVFLGSHLVIIDFADHRGKLTLQYRQGKLHSVTDRLGDTLVFTYVPNKPNLSRYGDSKTTQLSGALQHVTLPNGQKVRYEYDQKHNLSQIIYSDGKSTTYRYADTDWPNHLTHRHQSDAQNSSHWQYDEFGKATHWEEGDGTNGLTIERSNQKDSKHPQHTQATVTYLDGRQTTYQWSTTQDAFSHSAINIECDNCLPGLSDQSAMSPKEEILTNRNAPLKQDNPPSTTQSVKQNLTNEKRPDDQHSFDNLTLKETVPIIWQSLSSTNISISKTSKPSDNGNTAQLPSPSNSLEEREYTGQLNGFYPTSKSEIPLTIHANKRGRVVDITLNDRSLMQLAKRSIAGSSPTCFEGKNPPNKTTFTHDRLQALANGAEPCQLDGLVVTEFLYHLEAYNQSTHVDIGSDARSKANGKKVPWYSPLRRYCEMPPGKSCQDLASDLEMARLSHCAYGNVSCEPRYELIHEDDPRIRSDEITLSDDGFEAQIYRDPTTERYIVAFRGTDGVGDDWSNNFGQAMGRQSRQYDLAVRLARAIEIKLPGVQVDYTGHSLGGGLATVAAMATNGQATIFNAASLQQASAVRYGVQKQYNNAHLYINHVHTYSDPVTALQVVDPEASGRQFSPVPGRSTTVVNPDILYVNSAHENATSFVQGLVPVIWHSIEAVIHVLENLIQFNCKP